MDGFTKAIIAIGILLLVLLAVVLTASVMQKNQEVLHVEQEAAACEARGGYLLNHIYRVGKNNRNYYLCMDKHLFR